MRISDWSSECALPISAGNGGSEARVDTRHILDETGIVNMMRLVVETTLLARERVRRLAVEIGVVGEEAGIGQAEGGERRREIQLDAPGLSVTDIPRRVEIRSEERRGGKECVMKCRSGWSPIH